MKSRPGSAASGRRKSSTKSEAQLVGLLCAATDAAGMLQGCLSLLHWMQVLLFLFLLVMCYTGQCCCRRLAACRLSLVFVLIRACNSHHPQAPLLAGAHVAMALT